MMSRDYLEQLKKAVEKGPRDQRPVQGTWTTFKDLMLSAVESLSANAWHQEHGGEGRPDGRVVLASEMVEYNDQARRAGAPLMAVKDGKKPLIVRTGDGQYHAGYPAEALDNVPERSMAEREKIASNQEYARGQFRGRTGVDPTDSRELDNWIRTTGRREETGGETSTYLYTMALRQHLTNLMNVEADMMNGDEGVPREGSRLSQELEKDRNIQIELFQSDLRAKQSALSVTGAFTKNQQRPRVSSRDLAKASEHVATAGVRAEVDNDTRYDNDRKEKAARSGSNDDYSM